MGVARAFLVALSCTAAAALAATGDRAISAPPTQAPTFEAPPIAVVSPADRKALALGATVDLIVEFEHSAIDQLADVARASRGLATEDEAILDARVREYGVVKQNAARAMSQKGGLELVRDYSHLPMAVVRASGYDAVERILTTPGVVGVYTDVRHRLELAESLPLIHQPQASAQGANGSGTTVAVLDTGVDYTRSAFGFCAAPGGSCKVVHAQDFAAADGALDDNGHGTNVAGIVLGVAPGARIAALDVFFRDSGGWGASSGDIIAAMNWSIANRAAYNIVAMNMSLGDRSSNATTCASWATTPIANARAAGIATVIASGNDNHKNGISGPACAAGAISVGAVYDSNRGFQGWSVCVDATTRADQATCFSNSAAILSMLAPGSSILAAGIPMSGTSQATPHAAGAVAVMRANFPGETFDAAVSRLVSTGTPVTDVNGITKARIDILNALSGGRPTLTVGKAGSGSGVITSAPAGINCGASCSASFNTGTAVTLTAFPAAGSVFAGWSGAGCSGTGTCTVILNSAVTVTASFTAVPIALSVAKAGAGSGTVTSSPAGIDCGPTCSATFGSGATVTLNAAASPGSTFEGWSGDCSGTTQCTVTMTASRSVTARFGTASTFVLSVSRTGSGSGRVTTSPSGIDCGGACSANYSAGTAVTLSASPAAGSTFGGWGGACSGTGSCVVTMSSARSVVAAFISAAPTLTIAKAGGGLGVVTSTPGGISCGESCSASYNSGTFIGIQAAPDGNSIFAGWSGGGCGGTGPCALILTEPRTVTATFEPAPAMPLTVASGGSGGGRITSLPAGIDCGSTCVAGYRLGTSVTLTATPSAGSTFAGWSGACTGTAACTVTMAAARSVTATFNAITTATYALSVAIRGTAGGTVTSSPMGISCGTACVSHFAPGTTVLLSARTVPGVTFSGWSGNCTGITADCFVTMSSARSVTATFEGVAIEPIKLTVVHAGTGTGSVVSKPDGISCGALCSTEYNWGASVELTPKAAAGSTFVGWEGASCSGTSPCSLTLTSSATVKAIFAQDAAPPLVSPASLDFGGQSMRTTSPAQRVTLTNAGLTALTFTSVTTSGNFSVTRHDCASLAAGASCQADIQFTPMAEGALTGELNAAWNGGTSTARLSGVGEKSLVTHYYRAILRRPPDTGGRDYWLGEAARMQSLGANLNEAWFALAGTFYSSPEYMSFNRDTAGFVTDLYNTFFNRPPDSDGMNYWSGQIAAGLPREIALVSFMFSSEFGQFTQAIFGNTSARMEIDMVTDFYRGIMGRLPDSEGLVAWSRQLQAAQCSGAAAVYASVEAISSGFTNSAEYLGRRRSNAQYVADMYNAFMRRGGDLAGSSFWIGQLDSSARTREDVRRQFAASAEFGARVAGVVAQGCM